jgi:hypothetical protein
MIKLSIHTASDMAKRGILLYYIEAALADPEWTERDPQPGLTRSFRSIAEFGGRYLRVVHRQDGDDIFVVTAHWDRGAKKL